ncbi:MAG: hypothetical protein KGK33_14685 [Hyphomicrobiales bacterium]|nr:hypothetical protein [Hyphomicrobiales bacterium]
MRQTTILPAILAMLPMAAVFTAQASLSEPAPQQCKTSPGSATPAGGHWYYRINRGDKRHCWFLSPVELHVRRAEQPQTPVAANDANSVAANPPALAATQASSAPPALPAPAALSAQPMSSASPAGPISEMEFASRWPGNLPAVEDASESAPSSVSSYSDQPTTEAATEPPLRWPLVETSGASTASVAAMALDKISLAGLMTTAGLLIAGWAAKFARRPAQPRRSDWRPSRPLAAERETRPLPRRGAVRPAGADATRLRVPA